VCKKFHTFLYSIFSATGMSVKFLLQSHPCAYKIFGIKFYRSKVTITTCFFMEYVYYKGDRYKAKAVDIGGNRMYSLFNEEGTLTHFITELQLDKRSLIDVCIETYLRLSERD